MAAAPIPKQRVPGPSWMWLQTQAWSNGHPVLGLKHVQEQVSWQAEQKKIQPSLLASCPQRRCYFCLRVAIFMDKVLPLPRELVQR